MVKAAASVRPSRGHGVLRNGDDRVSSLIISSRRPRDCIAVDTVINSVGVVLLLV